MHHLFRSNTLAPLLLRSNPADNAGDVALNASIALTFSEPVKAGSGRFIIGNGVATHSIPATGERVTLSGNTVTIDPFLNFAADSSYSVQIGNHAIQGLSGQAYAGIRDTTTLNFRTTADTQAPSAVVSMADTALKAGDSALLTVTFTETVTGFSNADLKFSHGSLSPVASADGGQTWQATFTPAANVSADQNVLTLNLATIEDWTGNRSPGKVSVEYAVDTIAPRLTLGSSQTRFKAGETATVTFTFSETPTGFTAGDIAVKGGSLSDLAVNPHNARIYTALFTPSGDTNTLAGAISVAAGKYSDAAGNPGAAGNKLSLSGDTLAPTPAISSDKTALKAGETATVAFAFSEAPEGYPAVAVDGGRMTGLVMDPSDSKLYTAQLTPLTNSSHPAVVSVASGAFSDAAGNANLAATPLSLAVDTIAPTLTISGSSSALKIGDIATLIFTLSEAATDFTAPDISISGGVLSNFTGSGINYSASLTPIPGATRATAYVAANAYTDPAGNPNLPAIQWIAMADTLAPTLTLTSSDDLLKSGDVATLTFKFNETVSGFSSEDVTVNGGLLADFAGSGARYTATFTPTAGSNGQAGFRVADHAVIDAAGNPNPAAATLSLMVDSTAPTLTLSSDDPALNIGEIATLSFMLSEAANDFTADDIAVTGGVLANFAGSGTAYSAQFTPTADSSTPAGIGVAGGAFSDAAGNPNPAANPLNLAVDTLAPTVTLSSSDAYLLYGESAVLSFTLSEAVSDFTVDDIAVTGGSLSRFSGSGVSYSATFTPASDSYFNAAPVSVAAGRCSDAAGNGNLAATPLLMTIFTYPPDTTPPAVTSLAVTSATGLQNNALNAGDVVSVTVTLNEATNVTGTPQLALTIGGATVQADYVSGSGSTALVYSYTIQSGQTDADGIRVAANSLSLNGGTLKDGAGNAATLTHAEVADNASYTVDTEATCTLSAISGGYVNNAEDESSVTVGGTTVGVEDNQTATVHLNGKHYTATVTSNAFSVTVPSADIKALTEGTVTVTADVSDAAGNAAIQASRSFSYDITAPSFTSGTTASVAENTASGTSVYDATADGDAGVTYGLTGVDAAKFTLDTGNGTVSLAFLPNFEAPADSGANNVYDFSVRATDAAGNTTDQAVTLTVTNVAEAGESSIDLGAAYGKLIYPVNVDGKWYYYWDLSGDGTNANTQGSGYTNATDTTTHDVLDSLFTRDINAATGGGDTDNTYRYATLNGVKVALPTVTGAASFSMDAFQPGTPVGNGATPSNGSTATNSTYDDLLAIWDAYNGTMGGTNSNGTPSGWSLTNYWSATPSASGHANVFLYDGYVNDTLDNSSYYVALEVL